MNQRGIGYFVKKSGYTQAKNYMLEAFINNDLKNVFRKMEILNLDIDKLTEFYSKYKKQKKGL